MSDFKVGDRVKVVDQLPDISEEVDFIGNTGEVVGIAPSFGYEMCYTVALDNAAGAQVRFYSGEVEKID